MGETGSLWVMDAPAIVGWIGIRLGLLWDWLLIWGCGVLWDFIQTGMARTKEQDDGVDDGIVGLGGIVPAGRWRC